MWSAKRKAFYKTDAGLEVRRKYREKAETKAKLIDELSLDTIITLVKKLN